MIITEKARKIFLLDSQNPLQDILKSRNERTKNLDKGYIIPIYFYKYIGIPDNEASYLEQLRELESCLKTSANHYLIITKGLTSSYSNEEIERAAAIWDEFIKWESTNEKSYLELYNIAWDTKSGNNAVNWTIKLNLIKMLDLFEGIEKNTNQSIRKNFGLSLILWINIYSCYLFSDEIKSNHIPKFILWGAIRRNEAYFSIFLSMLGCDVLYINPVGDKEFSRIDPENTYAKLIEYDIKRQIVNFPETKKNKDIRDLVPSQYTAQITPTNQPNIVMFEKITTVMETKKIEKSYEELAKLSQSIVMINVYDEDKDHCGSGSGVVIDDNGTIVTNYHVIEDGTSFGIIFEDDETEHITRTVVAKKGQTDLALLRIDHRTLPVPIENSDDLKRGQEIVAIGSPLGLMNTISDGIIAGFRSFDNQNFIQITAPISPGSSGGALLNRYGALVGITTGGYTKGQNLNLAIPSNEIRKLLFVASLSKPRKKPESARPNTL